VHIADRPLDQRAPSQVTDDDPATFARWVVDGQDEAEENGRTKYTGKTRRILVYSQPQAFKDGYVVLLADDAPFREYFGRVVPTADLADAQQLRQWLSECETEHGRNCDESLVHPDLMREIRDVLRAIDVEEMRIVDMPLNARYVALSYLWGRNFKQLFTTSDNLPKLSKVDALSKEKLPRTIKDAIKLTKLLGERFLWTDSLALVHDEGFQYHDDWVYARATLTLVAGSGKDANAGLPGVRPESRVFHQEIEQVKADLRLMVSHLAEDYISTSQWDARAWTYQERMLSRRCLIFCNGRIYFQCRRATYCEDIEMPISAGWSLNSIDMPTRIFEQPPFVQFTSAVELYTQREMTNPNDILNAFDEVKLVLEKRIASDIYFGIVEDMVDSSIIWESSRRLRHRPNFPSWSWAGWVAEIQWKLAEYAESWIEWHDIGPDPTSFPPQKRPRMAPPIPRPPGMRTRPGRTKAAGVMPQLRFATIAASFMLQRPAPIHKDSVSPLRKRMTGPSALSTVRPTPTDPGLVRAGIADRNGQWCGTIDLDNGYMRMVDIPFEFLVMSRVSGFTEDEQANWEGLLPDTIEEEMAQRDYGVYNVLLVSERGSVHYRAGLGRILTSCLDRALEPGPVWKDITLA
jgi:Heterokaryon incompatibility protein (HET)